MRLWCNAAIMRPIVPCLVFVMWPRESRWIKHRSIQHAFRSGEKPVKVWMRSLLRNCLSRHHPLPLLFFFSCSTSHHVLIEQCAECEGAIRRDASFISDCLKRTETVSVKLEALVHPSGSNCSRNRACFCKKIHERGAATSLLPSLSFSQGNSGGLSGLWSGEKCLLCD